MTRHLVFAFIVSCGARTELDVVSVEDAAAHDAHTDVIDATPIVDVTPPPICDFGTIVASIDANVVYWNGGQPLPAGHYRVKWVDGCMKYSSSQGWTVNAYANGPDAYFIVSGTSIATAPGTVGFIVGQGAYASFDDCVQANANDAIVEFDFAGGVLGVQLADNPYTDNVAGNDDRNPTYALSSCP